MGTQNFLFFAVLDSAGMPFSSSSFVSSQKHRVAVSETFQQKQKSWSARPVVQTNCVKTALR